MDYNPWRWLTSQSAAEAMAEQVATWFDKYNVDGIDLDIEEGAGSKPDSGVNMVHFIRRLRQLKPDIIIGQPTYGYPAVNTSFFIKFNRLLVLTLLHSNFKVKAYCIHHM